MSRSSSRLAAILLFSSASVAFAQESAINKSDLPDPRSSIDQAPVTVGDAKVDAPSAPQSKTRITNAGSAYTDLNTPGRTREAAARDVNLQQAVTGTEPQQRKLSEFQKFIESSTGRKLPIFGMEFFANTPSTFAPILNTPVPSDDLLIRGWGSIDIDFRATIDRNGLITIPTVGAVVLGGVSAANVENVVRAAIARLYKDVTVSVNFGQLRAINIYVVGQAQRPGTYTVSSMSTLVTALFASGGPNANGSMRRVQIKRGGKVAAELDLYAFIAKGDKSTDVKLRDGDTIYIPPASGYVALVGTVNTPAIYELRGKDDTVSSLLEFAGGLPVVANPHRATLERIDPRDRQPRSVEQFQLDSVGLAKSLKGGDLLNINSITPEFSNAVVLRGNVDQSLRAPFRPGMRVRDLIPSREYLISRSSTNRQNNTYNAGESEKEGHESAGTIAGSIGGLIDPINWDYAVVERVNRADLSVSLLPFNLGNVFANPAGQDNIELQPGDTVTIFSQSDVAVPLDKRRVFVRVEGEVNLPGVYQMKSGDNLQNLLARAGGATGNAYLFGTEFYRDQVRREQELNLERAANRLEAQLRSEQTKSAANTRSVSATDTAVAEVKRQAELENARGIIARLRTLKPTGRIAFGLEPKEQQFSHIPPLKLENGDRLVVPARPDFVHVFGAVSLEASPLWRPGYTVGKYLKQSGLTSEADKENIFVMRADGSVVTGDSQGWLSRGLDSIEVMPGDSIVVPEKLDKETGWSRFTVGVREWSQILANFGLGAAAIKVLK